MKKNFKTLEVGKTYKNRLGELVKIIYTIENEDYPFEGDDFRFYSKSGKYIIGGNHYNDLIELVEGKQINLKLEKTQTEEPVYIRRFPSGAIRSDDRGRERPDFISPYALYALGKYLAGTENSFAKINYLKGIPTEECWASLCRHHVEVGILMAKKSSLEELKKAVAALTFNGVAMLHTLELIERGEYIEKYPKTEYILKSDYKEE